MSCQWVCASCRRALQQRTRRSIQSQRARQASYIPFHAPSEDHENDFGSPDVRRPRPRRRPPGYIDWQFDKSVENDFIHRISENRTQAAGPYSSQPRKRSEENDRHRNGGRNGSQHMPSDGNRQRASSPRVYKRNGVTARAHPLDLDEPTRNKRPWFGIPSTQTALADLGYAPADPSKHRYLNASLSMSGALDGDGSDHLAYQTSTGGASLLEQRGTPSSFFDQYFEQARDAEPSQPDAKPLTETLEKLQTAHELAVPGMSKRRQILASPKTGKVCDKNSSDVASKSDEHAVRDVEGVAGEETASLENDDSVGILYGEQLTAKSEQISTHPSKSWKEVLRLNANSRKALDRQSIEKLGRNVIGPWCVLGSAASRVPKPARILEALGQDHDRTSRASLSVDILWITLAQAIQRSFLPRNGLEAVGNGLIEHVLEVWSIIFKNFIECYVRDSSGVIQQLRGGDEESSFPAWEQLAQVEYNLEASFKTRLLDLFPRDFHSPLQSLDTAALVTWALLDEAMTKSGDSTTAMTPQQTPARDFFTRLVAGEKLNLGTHSKVLQKRCLTKRDSAALIAYLKRLTDDIDPSIIADDEDPTSRANQPQVQVQQRSSGGPSTDLFKKRIARAIEGQDAGRLARTWRKIQSSFGATDTTPESYSAIPSQLYAHLLTAYMALGRPNGAIDIWNVMTGSGIEPAIEHWDSMLKGCGVARNSEAAQSVWENLVNAGVKPDAQLWATRIHALGASGRIEAAVEAFQTMTRQWLEATESGNKKERNNKAIDSSIPKPTTQCLNALVAVLARGKRHARLVQVLTWRKALNIPADSFTYNPLLKAALREGNLDLASKLLQQMQSAGVTPDVATFTMMLDSAFQQQATYASDVTSLPPMEESNDPLNLEAVAPEQSSLNLPAVTASQQATIGAVFDLMSEQSLKPTAHTFATLVTGLLHSDPPNTVAAHGILQYLGSHGLPLSPQLYTALVSHHFEQSPPELAAVDALWHDANYRRKAARPLILDAFFYDRFIEGWARNGHIDRAMRVRRVAKARGKIQNWEALRELLEGLARAEEWEAAQKLLNESKQEEHAAGNDHARSRRGEAAFWDTAKAMGLEDVATE